MTKRKEVSPAPGFAAPAPAPAAAPVPGWPAPAPGAAPAPAWPAPGPGAPPAVPAAAPGTWGNPFGQTPAVQPISGPINADDFAMNQYLKGSDLPQGVNQIDVRITGFVRIQGSRSPMVAQIEANPSGKIYLPLNKTNIQQLAAFIGKDLSAAIGKLVTLVVYPVNNPSQGGLTRGLYVAGVK